MSADNQQQIEGQPIPDWYKIWARDEWMKNEYRHDFSNYEKACFAAYRKLTETKAAPVLPPSPLGEARALDRQEYAKWIRNTIQDELSDGNHDSLAERLAFEFDAHVSAVYEGGEEWKSLYENLKSNPSRAGEISPVLRWVKASERLPEAKSNIFFKYSYPGYPIEKLSGSLIDYSNDEQYFVAGGLSFNSMKYLEWLEEIPPTPAPEVKEEQPLETFLDFENHGDTIRFNCPDDDSDIAVIVKNKGARHAMVYSLTLEESEEVASFLSRHVNNENRCNPPEPVKDNPEDQEDIRCLNWLEQCHVQCESCKSEDQAADIQGDITDANLKEWALSESKDLAQRDKDFFFMGVGQLYAKFKPQIATLTQQRDVARTSEQKLIDDLDFQSVEIGEYRKALEGIMDFFWRNDRRNRAHEIKKMIEKYPSPNKNQTNE